MSDSIGSLFAGFGVGGGGAPQTTLGAPPTQPALMRADEYPGRSGFGGANPSPNPSRSAEDQGWLSGLGVWDVFGGGGTKKRGNSSEFPQFTAGPAQQGLQPYAGGGGYDAYGQPQTRLTPPGTQQAQQPLQQLGQLPQEGPHEATRHRCLNVLHEFQEILMAVDKDLKSASPDQRASLMGAAIKKCRGADKEANSLLRELPSQMKQGVDPALGRSLPEFHGELRQSLAGLEAAARPVMKELPSASSEQEISNAMVQKLDGEAPVLHQRLEQLKVALDEWDKAVRSRTNLTGSFDASSKGGTRKEELAVEMASAAFEDFRAGLVIHKKGLLERAGDALGRSRKDENTEMEAIQRGVELLRVLNGLSPWCDQRKIQELLGKRQEYFLDRKYDPNYTRFTCGQRFLELIQDQKRWPEAELLALRWNEILEKNLGKLGTQDWKARSARLQTSWEQRAVHEIVQDEKLLCSFFWHVVYAIYEFFIACCSPYFGPVQKQPLLPGGASAGSGKLMITKIRAANLRSADILDQSDPYVKFSFPGMQPVKTKTVDNNEKNPKWLDPRNASGWEEVIIEVPNLSAALKVEVWDEDYFTQHDPLGENSLNVMRLLEQTAVAQGQGGWFGGPPDLSSIQVSGAKVNLDLRGPNAGDREPVVEFEMTWTPKNPGAGAGAPKAASGPSLDPLMLQPKGNGEDVALRLVGQVDAKIIEFQRSFGPQSEVSAGFFLQEQDLDADAGLFSTQDGTGTHFLGQGSAASTREMQEVESYNRILSEIRSVIHMGSSQGQAIDWSKLDQLIASAKSVERNAGSSEKKRRLFAFQDELLPQIGEWSTDRRRKLRNEVFLAKLNSSFVAAFVPVNVGIGSFDWGLYMIPLLVLLALGCNFAAFWALQFGKEEDGRGWTMILASFAGFLCLAGAATILVPRWMPYFEKRAVPQYQRLPP
eukprot:TRINITY_DN91860_c0_g1_i1.p1 TRINITY_DN91860_c0_g1~~TRINITY_DN91860_c0_g1_i1.p1  ORF type:complete len:936 (-),score=210.43 TRINITY_DN91860_c0_g1_i1:62-2869(-)